MSQVHIIQKLMETSQALPFYSMLIKKVKLSPLYNIMLAECWKHVIITNQWENIVLLPGCVCVRL